MTVKIVEPDNLKHYAIVVDGKVVNTVVWDGTTEYNPGDEYSFVDLTGMQPEPGIDWDYVDGEFVDNRPVEEPFGLE
jgi:hypothetical protein